MIVTKDRYMVQLITKHKGTGDEVYEILRRNQHEPDPTGNPFIIELSSYAWAGQVIATQEFVDLFDEFSSGGYPASLTMKGKTKAEIDALRDVISAKYYDLYENEGSRAVRPSALDDFIAAQGYTKV